MHTQTTYRTAFQMVNWKIEPTVPHTHIHFQAIKAGMKAGATLRQQVVGFHRMYDLPVRTNPVDKLADVSNDEIALRIKLNCEEFIELMSKGYGLNCSIVITTQENPGWEEAHRFEGWWTEDNALDERDYGRPLAALIQETRPYINVIEIADASGDLKYVLEGQDVAYGIPSTDVSREIHASNMTKLDEDGNVIRREDGKILKGPNYMEPQLNAIITFRKEY